MFGYSLYAIIQYQSNCAIIWLYNDIVIMYKYFPDVQLDDAIFLIPGVMGF